MASKKSIKQLTDVEKFDEIAIREGIEDWTPTLPIAVICSEAVELGRFCESYYEPAYDAHGQLVRRGLNSVEDESRHLNKNTGKDLIALQGAVQQAQTEWLMTVKPLGTVDPVARARELLNEITATLTWFLDDGVIDEQDARLERIRAAHATTPDTIDALASELADYATFAKTMQDRLDSLGGFDASCIDEAMELILPLRERSVQSAASSDEAKTALARRNRLLGLLVNRMTTVRAAARFVFRDQPEIAQLATSRYQRKRRARARKSAQETPEVIVTPAVSNG